MDNILIKIAPELKKKLQIKCIEENTTMTDVITNLIKQYLSL